MHSNQGLSQQTKAAALANGGDLAGIVRAEDLPEHAESISRILPGAKSVLVVAAAHSLAALSSQNNEVAQFDTGHTYQECARAALTSARFLESIGYPSVAVPAFIPLDMDPPKKGMRGEICWRRAGVRAGLGSYGENGLLVTREYGSAVRLAGVVTTAELAPDQPLADDLCDHCLRCLDVCPPEALSGEGKVNKKLCGDKIFEYGFRTFQRLLLDMVEKPREQNRKALQGPGLLKLWQTFVSGDYYFCFQCQTQCPAQKLPRRFV